jgi:hypothetical protein
MPLPSYLAVQVPQDLLIANHFVLNLLDGSEMAPIVGGAAPPLASPNFQEVSGLTRSIAVAEVYDAGTGLKYEFHGGQLQISDLTFSRMNDGTEDDYAMIRLFNTIIQQGRKVNAKMDKFHKGVLHKSYAMYQLLFKQENNPSYSAGSANAEKVDYNASCVYWEVLRNGDQEISTL